MPRRSKSYASRSRRSRSKRLRSRRSRRSRSNRTRSRNKPYRSSFSELMEAFVIRGNVATAYGGEGFDPSQPRPIVYLRYNGSCEQSEQALSDMLRGLEDLSRFEAVRIEVSQFQAISVELSNSAYVGFIRRFLFNFLRQVKLDPRTMPRSFEYVLPYIYDNDILDIDWLLNFKHESDIKWRCLGDEGRPEATWRGLGVNGRTDVSVCREPVVAKIEGIRFQRTIDIHTHKVTYAYIKPGVWIPDPFPQFTISSSPLPCRRLRHNSPSPSRANVPPTLPQSSSCSNRLPSPHTSRSRSSSPSAKRKRTSCPRPTRPSTSSSSHSPSTFLPSLK